MDYKRLCIIFCLISLLPLGIYAQRNTLGDSPATELTKRIIMAKHQTKLEINPYYQYRNYERLTIALNEMPDPSGDSGSSRQKANLKNNIEKNPITGTRDLPIATTEKISRYYFRQYPLSYKAVIEAESSKGISDFIETGDMFNALSHEVFSNVNIYDNTVRLFNQEITSPISDNAIGFYQYHIVDTLKIGNDSCIALAFAPISQKAIGFNGNLYIVKDSTLHIKCLHLQIPKRSDIQYITGIDITQEYTQMPNGQWVLSVNDMLIEMTLSEKNGKFLISHTSRQSDYSFAPIDKKIFRDEAAEVYDPYAKMRTKEYWQVNRDVALSHGEAEMDNFIRSIRSEKHLRWIMTVTKVIKDNYIETTKSDNPSKIDIGPINSIFSYNYVDGFRIKPAFITTANLHPQIFLKGYAAHGFASNKNYYGATLTYSINKKVYLPLEFPKRNVVLSSEYDICSASDKFSQIGKDNLLGSVRWASVKRMSLYNKQSLHFQYETDWGFCLDTGLDFEKKTAIGDLYYNHLGESREKYTDYFNHGTFRTTEASVQLTFSPGQHYLNDKFDRIPLNHESPVFKFKHTIGIQGFMGGEYHYNVTEASAYKCFGIPTWGTVDVNLKAGIQWNKVPFPLLIAAAANQSIIKQNETFNLVTDMEFLNDRYVSLMANWDLEGKLFNLIPIINLLNWHENIGINILWGTLSDKNNPTLAENKTDAYLMEMPTGTTVMNPNRPYAEISVGIGNILKFFRIDYVRRINYNEDTIAPKNTVRLGFNATF